MPHSDCWDIHPYLDYVGCANQTYFALSDLYRNDIANDRSQETFSTDALKALSFFIHARKTSASVVVLS